MEKPTLTVIIPVYNEALAFAEHFEAIADTLDALEEVKVDILIVNDGSRDNTEAVVSHVLKARDDAALISFTRNFGKEAAIQAGLDHAQGDAVVVMDSDLQHPPELIPEMLRLWRDGALIVEAYKKSRGRESILYKLFAKAFYAIFNRLAGLNLTNQCDYKLLDHSVVEVYRNLPEKNHFFRGIVTWLGFPSLKIPFVVPTRRHGVSAWSSFRLLKYSLSALTSFTALPLQFVTMLGSMTLVIALVFGAIALNDKLSGTAVSGFTTVILLILIIGSVLMVSIGLVGIYIARIYDEIKGRPTYVVKPTPSTSRKKT